MLGGDRGFCHLSPSPSTYTAQMLFQPKRQDLGGGPFAGGAELRRSPLVPNYPLRQTANIIATEEGGLLEQMENSREKFLTGRPS